MLPPASLSGYQYPGEAPADVAQLVAHQPSKLVVAGSSLVIRSIIPVCPDKATWDGSIAYHPCVPEQGHEGWFSFPRCTAKTPAFRNQRQSKLL